MTTSAIEAAILAVVLPWGRAIVATTLYTTLARSEPTLTYGDFWEALMALDRRGLVKTGEILGKGDDPPRVWVRCP